MAESTLSLSRADLDLRIGVRLGYRDDVANYTATQKATINFIRNDALSRFYFPSVAGQPDSHVWSFLKIEKTLAISSGTATYTLPDDDTGEIIEMQVASQAGAAQIAIVPQAKLTMSRASEAASNAIPLYASIQVDGHTTSATVGQRWEIEFYPTPDASYTVSYTSSVLPNELTSTLDYYPLGNAMHQQVLIEAALSVAVEYLHPDMPPEQNTHLQRFESLLATAISRDAKLQSAGDIQAVTAPTAGTFDWFRREIAGKRFDKWNLFQLTHSEKATVERLLTSGLNRLYFPLVPGQDRFHEWSFLKIEMTLNTISGTSTYELPDSFGGKLNNLQITSVSGNSLIEVVSQDKLTQSRGSEAASNAVPAYASIQTISHTTSASDEQRWEIEFYPTPDDAYTIAYTVAVLPGEIDTAHTYYPLGTEIHQQALLESVLAVACEEISPEQAARHDERFQRLLLAAIDQDMKVKKVGDLQAITAPTAGSFDYFRREIAGRAFDKWNIHQLSHSEKAAVERLLTSALDRFYRPEMAGEGLYRWSFLEVEYTLTTVADQEDYTLSADHGGVIGSMFLTATNNVLGQVTKTSVDNILSKRANNITYTSAQPLLFAERATAGDGTAEQVFEVLLWPTPTAVYTLTGTRFLEPDQITSSTPYPLGGRAHRETILAACRAVAELEKSGKAGSHEKDFQKRLTASLQSDLQTHQPQILGYNGNNRRAQSPRRPDGRFENFTLVNYPSGTGS